MNEQIVNVATEAVQKKGFGAIELGLAAIGVVSVGKMIYDGVKTAKKGSKVISDLADDIKEELKDLFEDPTVKKATAETIKEKVS